MNLSTVPAAPIVASCACGTSRRLPVWAVTDTLEVLRERLTGALEPGQPVLTYRCRICKQVVPLTAKDLGLA